MLFTCYDLAWRLALPLLRLHPRLKDGYEARTLRDGPQRTADLWIHAASAGEAYLATQIIDALPEDSLLNARVTTNTRQGLEILEKFGSQRNGSASCPQIDPAFCPFDQPAIMERAVKTIDPKVVVLLETELWPGLLFALRRNRRKVLLLNGRITPKSLKRYRLIPDLCRSLSPDFVLAVSPSDARRFGQLFGEERVGVMPNIKFDRIQLAHSSDDRLRAVGSRLPENARFLILGSIRQEEEPDVGEMIKIISSRFPDLIIGLFPRHMYRLTAWQRRLDKTHANWVLRSTLGAQPVAPGTLVLWDTFGELSAAYAHATAVFVGGSLAPLGGQNFLEPLIHGISPVIGPSWENFAWIGEAIISRGIVRKTRNREAAAAELMQQLKHPPDREEIRSAAAAYIKARQGGTRQACRLILNMLDEN